MHRVRTQERGAASVAPGGTRMAVAVPVVLAAVMVLWSAISDAASRVALVVGNGGYDPANISRLANPVNDARMMAHSLERVGFEVAVETDAGQDAMRRAIKAFGKRLREAGRDAVGLFYYAGHGVEAGGSNFLIPLGAEVESATDLQSDAVPAQWVLSRMEEAGNRLNMVVLDACRNNPYAGRVRSGGRGLARIDAPSGSLVAYSAAPGQVAADGEGENSPYTLALASALVEPGLKVEDVFKQVRVRVEDETGRMQTPWESSSLKGDFYFLPPRDADDGPGPVVGGVGEDAQEGLDGGAHAVVAQRMETEREFWVSIKDSEDPADFEAYLKKFGEDGSFSPLAHNRLAELNATEGATAVQAETPMSSQTTTRRVFRDCGVCPEIAVVPAGQFMMGNPDWKKGPGSWDGPQHRVSIRKPFAVGVYEVTRGEFSHFVDDTGYVTTAESDEPYRCEHYDSDGWHHPFDWREPGFGQTDDHPVVCVSWHDARAYVAWLTKKTGATYRLLSESEWEYVAHGGTQMGRLREVASDQCRHENSSDAMRRDSGDAPGCDGYAWTSPVGSYTKNGFGLYDVLGNVLEWVEDCWNDSYLGAPDDGSARNQGECDRRIPRGSYWGDDITEYAITGRESGAWIGHGGDGTTLTGIRVARTLNP